MSISSSSSTDSDSNSDSVPSPKPFLKWAGGKSQLLPELKQRFPKKYQRYFEPFIGGGALFFNLMPSSSYISDINSDLINCYQVVRDQLGPLIEELRTYRNEEELFYEVRSIDRQTEFETWSNVKRAARLIFLNRTCFNGLYRVNSKGYFNVPFGKYKNPPILSPDNLYACAKVLAGTEIECASFLSIESKVKSADFVYFDPPYAPLSPTSNFTAYAKTGFAEEQQRELRDLCRRLNQKGVYWILSNSSAELIEDLYQEFDISVVQARRNINSVGLGRGEVEEFIIRNYKD